VGLRTLDVALPADWGIDSRGFWTRRKKAGLALFVVLAIVTGIAVAFKLFDKNVTNNVAKDGANFDYLVQVLQSPGSGQPKTWRNAGTTDGAGQPIAVFAAGFDQYPGDLRTEDVRIQNTNVNPARDATFFFYVAHTSATQTSIEVRGCPNGCAPGVTPPVVTPGSADWNTFLSFWTLEIQKENVLTPGALADVNENDHNAPPPSPSPTIPPGSPAPPDTSNGDTAGNRSFSSACSSGLTQLTVSQPCNLGTVRAYGSRELRQSTEPSGNNGSKVTERTDVRYYKFGIRETDTQTDQSRFKGWTVTFTLVFQARVPAQPEPGPVVR
jgi:hypothetical protein